MIELAFLIGFNLHNLEEALWLPDWSTRAGRFCAPVGKAEFRFAISVVTALGYALTACNFAFGTNAAIVRYAYLGFVGMMALNAVFPHLVASIALRGYAPGLLTGLLFNLPLGAYIAFVAYRSGVNLFGILLAVIAVSGVVIASLKPLFAVGVSLGSRVGAVRAALGERRNKGST